MTDTPESVRALAQVLSFYSDPWSRDASRALERYANLLERGSADSRSTDPEAPDAMEQGT